MKVYVVWDPLYEDVRSVHKTKETAAKRCSQLDDNLHKTEKENNDHTYDHCWVELDLEE